MFSYFEPNFLEKFFWESGFSNFGQNRIDTKQKSVILPPFWNGTTFLIFFSRIVIFYSPYTYGTNFIAKFRWESGFLRLGP